MTGIAATANSAARVFPTPARNLTEPRIVRVALIGAALGFLVLFLAIPLLSVFVEALRNGVGAYAAAIIEPGKRTGQFRIGMDRLVTDESGSSRISVEDFAVAVIDELDDPQFIQSRFTVAY